MMGRMYMSGRSLLLGAVLAFASPWVLAQVPLEIDRAVKSAIFGQLSNPAYKVGVEYLNVKTKVPSCAVPVAPTGP